MYKPLPNGLFIKDSNIQGQGLFTNRDLTRGCDLGTSHLRIDESGVNSINEEENKNIFIRTPLGGFINHSNTPNCHRKWIVTVIENIKAGDELTLKYTMYHPTEPPKDKLNINGMAYLGGP